MKPANCLPIRARKAPSVRNPIGNVDKSPYNTPLIKPEFDSHSHHHDQVRSSRQFRELVIHVPDAI
jgi:hypothetical protein